MARQVRKPYGSHEVIDEGRAVLYTDNPITRIVEMSYDGHQFYIESTSYHHAVTEAIRALHLYKFVAYESRGIYPPVGERAILICVDPPHNEQERGRRLGAHKKLVCCLAPSVLREPHETNFQYYPAPR